MNAIVGSVAAFLAVLVSGRFVHRVLPHRSPPLQGGHRSGPRAGAPRTRLDAFTQSIRHRRRLRLGLTPDAVAEWCDALARRVRSGTTLRESVQVEIPPDRLLADLTDALRLRLERGRSLADAVAGPMTHGTTLQEPRGLRWQRDGTQSNDGTRPELREPKGMQHLTLTCSVIAAASELGGSPAAALDRAATALRLRAADGQERTAQSAQARLSATVLTVVPSGILTLLAATDRDVRAVLGTTIGAACVGTGITLNIIGWSWMRRTIESAA